MSAESSNVEATPGLRVAARYAATLTWRAAPGTTLAYVVLVVLESAAPVTAAWLTKLLLDRLVGGGPIGWLAAGLGVVGVVLAVVPACGAYVNNEIGRRVGLHATDRLYAATEQFTGLARFEDPRFVDRLRMAKQAAEGCASLATGVFGMAHGALMLVGFVGSLLVLSPTMTVIVVVIAVPALLAQLRLSRRRATMTLSLGPTERREFFYSELLTGINAVKEIRLFGAARFLRDRMIGERVVANTARRRLDRSEMRAEAGLGALGALAAGGGLLWAILAVRSGGLTIGDVTVFLAAVAGVQGGLHSLIGSIATTHHDLLMFQHFAAVVDTGPDQSPPARPAALAPLRHGIELRGVWFRYSDEHPWILRGVDLFIAAGSSTALVGLNGAGKSTLVKLLCRFYDPTRGSILWDGTDLRDVPVADLRQRVSAVFQDHMNYDLSAAENVGIGDVTTIDDRARITAAAELAGADETLRDLPQGYDTLLSRIFFAEPVRGTGGDFERPSTGVVLSGGQWQRVALARAFFRDARDLAILDEPSSGLDAQAEHDLHQRMRQHRADGATLLISHRLNTVRDADQIIVLDNGAVTEAGTHAELLAGDGAYARLFRLQASGFRSEPDDPSSGDLQVGHGQAHTDRPHVIVGDFLEVV